MTARGIVEDPSTGDIWLVQPQGRIISLLEKLTASDDTTNLDQDGDGLTDAQEVEITGTDPLDPDTDGDGCTDEKEVGDDETLGGQRDPLNPWDFYDVNGDRTIDLSNDIFGVIDHYSPTGDPPYDVQYDRGPWVGPNSWTDTAPPDGVIDLTNDINGVIAQYLHDCG